MAVAGFKCKIRRGGTPTAMLAEPMTNVAASRFQVTLGSRRCLDPNQPFHFADSVGTIPYGDISAVVFEFGEATLPTATGPVTVTGSFIPLGVADIVAEAKSFTLSETSDMLDKTVFLDGVPLRRRQPGLADASLSLELFVNPTDMPTLRAAYEAGDLMLFEVESGATAVFRGWGLIETLERSGSVDGLIEASVSWQLSAQREPKTGFVAGYSDRPVLST